MTLHVWLLSLIFILTAGGILTFLLNRLQTRYQTPYLQPLLFFNLLMLTEFLAIFVFYYLNINLPEIWTPYDDTILNHILAILPQTFGLGYLYFLTKVINGLQGRTKRPWITWLIFCFASILLLQLLCNLFIRPEHFLTVALKRASSLPFDYMSLVVFALLIPMLKKGADSPHATTATPFARYFLFRQTLYLVMIIFFVFFNDPKDEFFYPLSAIIDTLYIGLTIGLLFLWLNRHVYPSLNLQTKETLEGAVLAAISRRFNLSERECDVIKLIVAGKSNKEISVALDLSANTIKNHIYKIYQKLDINSRFELIDKVQKNTVAM